MTTSVKGSPKPAARPPILLFMFIAALGSYGLVTELVGADRLVAANGWLEVSVVCAVLLGTAVAAFAAALLLGACGSSKKSADTTAASESTAAAGSSYGW